MSFIPLWLPAVSQVLNPFTWLGKSSRRTLHPALLVPMAPRGFERPGWDETWLEVAATIAKRSLCINSKVGAVLVSSDNFVVSASYNGPPKGLNLSGPCGNWCDRAKYRGAAGAGTANYERCASIHAEANAIIRADHSQIQGGTLFCTRLPCIGCARLVANSGVARIVAWQTDEDDEVRSKSTINFLVDAGLTVDYWRKIDE